MFGTLNDNWKKLEESPKDLHCRNYYSILFIDFRETRLIFQITAKIQFMMLCGNIQRKLRSLILTTSGIYDEQYTQDRDNYCLNRVLEYSGC